MLEKFQPVKTSIRSYWLNSFLTKSKSILTENDNIVNILDADIIGAEVLKLFPEVLKLFQPPSIRHYFHSSAHYINGQN